MASHEASLRKTLAELIQAYFDARAVKVGLGAKTEVAALALATLDSVNMRETRAPCREAIPCRRRTPWTKRNWRSGGWKVNTFRMALGAVAADGQSWGAGANP
jgi:hypothetical protein